jgi:hypothetical protein
MKKILFLAVAILALVSCSKESRLNKKIDGTWDIVSVNGQLPSSIGLTMTIEFTKDKKGKGAFTSKITEGSFSESSTGTYVLTDDTKITMTETPTSGQVSTPEDMTINSYSKTDLTMTSVEDNTVIILKKK